MTQREPIPLERTAGEVLDCCGTCEHSIWVHRGRFRACDYWNIKLIYPTRDQMTRQRCPFHAYSEAPNAVELRVSLALRGATVADPSRERPVNIAAVPMPAQQAPAKGLVDKSKKIATLTDDQIRARHQQRWWRDFEEWDGSD